MNVIKNMTINLSPDDVKEIISDYVKNSFRTDNVTVEDVTLSTSSRCVGYYMDEHYEYYFSGASVKCKVEE